MSLYDLYRTGHVQRYAQNPEMAWTGQNLGQHQWGAAVLLLKLFGDRVNLALVWEALHHDTGEMGACDASSPAKRKHPHMARAISEAEENERIELGVPTAYLPHEETVMLHFVDRLESYLFTSVRAPWMLGTAGWPALRAELERQAWALGVGAEVQGLMREVDAR